MIYIVSQYALYIIYYHYVYYSYTQGVILCQAVQISQCCQDSPDIGPNVLYPNLSSVGTVSILGPMSCIAIYPPLGQSRYWAQCPTSQFTLRWDSLDIGPNVLYPNLPSVGTVLILGPMSHIPINPPLGCKISQFSCRKDVVE